MGFSGNGWGKASVIGLAALALPGATPMCDVVVEIEELRSDKGVLQICLTGQEKYFPDCENDPAARRMTVPAADAATVFHALPAGNYALAVVHDENANSKLDKFAGIPREGIGFSRNPRFTFGPPKFAKARFAAEPGGSAQTVKMRYFL